MCVYLQKNGMSEEWVIVSNEYVQSNYDVRKPVFWGCLNVRRLPHCIQF